jgi:hypothetical protein
MQHREPSRVPGADIAPHPTGFLRTQKAHIQLPTRNWSSNIEAVGHKSARANEIANGLVVWHGPTDSVDQSTLQWRAA